MSTFEDISLLRADADRTRAGAEAAHAIVSQVLVGYRGPVAVRLWNGRLAAGSRNAPCTVVIRHPGALRELVLHPDLLRLAEAHLAGAVEVEGDLEILFDLSAYLAQLRLPFATRLRLIGWAWRLPSEGYRGSECGARARTGRARHESSRVSIAHHYDVGNDFYGLWLDPEYVYSCAYFGDPGQSLAEAQRDKLDYICRKLRLAPGQSLLDIGCGWGALALWAARHHGVQVHGITLSEQQYQLARERVVKEDLGDRVSIELLDYRDLAGDGLYDRIVSVGMFEHVGVRNFPRYFGTVQRLLKPGGLFLNHGITSETGWRRTPLTRFMNRYIFPDGELARISDVMDAMERSGLEPLDVESLRPHYALTLRHWVHALEANREAAIRTSNEATYRLWRLYMAGSAHYFDEGSIGIYQVLAGRERCPLSVPLRRDDLYVVQAGRRRASVVRATGPLEVVGAGPAGLAAALVIRRAGVPVVVHERNADVGSRFHGDFQGIENWTTDGDALEELAELGIEPSFPAVPFREVVCFGPDGREHLFRSHRPLFYLVRRGVAEVSLDQALKRQALAAGAEIRFRSRVPRLPAGGIVTGGPRRSDVIASGYLFATDMADGAYAAVSERLAPGGYAYLLVQGGRATLATCLFADFHNEREYLGRTLGFFRDQLGAAPRDPRRFGGIGNVWVPRTARRGRLLYAGEAAGFQDALFGFGMRYALISGGLAGRALLCGGSNYDRLWRRRLRGLLRAGAVNRSIYARLGDSGYAAVLGRYPADADLRSWLRRAFAPVWWRRLLFPLTRLRRTAPVQPREGCDCTWCRCVRDGGLSLSEDVA